MWDEAIRGFGFPSEVGPDVTQYVFGGGLENEMGGATCGDTYRSICKCSRKDLAGKRTVSSEISSSLFKGQGNHSTTQNLTQT